MEELERTRGTDAAAQQDGKSGGNTLRFRTPGSGVLGQQRATSNESVVFPERKCRALFSHNPAPQTKLRDVASLETMGLGWSCPEPVRHHLFTFPALHGRTRARCWRLCSPAAF